MGDNRVVRFHLRGRHETFMIFAEEPNVAYYQREDGSLVAAFTYDNMSWGVVIRMKISFNDWINALDEARERALRS